MNVVRNVKKNILKGVLIANKLNRNKNKMTDEQVHEHPYKALMRYSDELTSEQLDYCVQENPDTALLYFAEKLTSEQLDYCVQECPAIALECYLKNRKNIARRKQNDRNAEL